MGEIEARYTNCCQNRLPLPDSQSMATLRMPESASSTPNRECEDTKRYTIAAVKVETSHVVLVSARSKVQVSITLTHEHSTLIKHEYTTTTWVKEVSSLKRPALTQRTLRHEHMQCIMGVVLSVLDYQ